MNWLIQLPMETMFQSDTCTSFCEMFYNMHEATAYNHWIFSCFAKDLLIKKLHRFPFCGGITNRVFTPASSVFLLLPWRTMKQWITWILQQLFWALKDKKIFYFCKHCTQAICLTECMFFFSSKVMPFFKCHLRAWLSVYKLFPCTFKW